MLTRADSQRGDEGYFSHLWLDRSISIVEVQLYSTLEDLTDPVNVHRLFQACCNACNAFRAAQKSRQLIRQWIDVRTTLLSSSEHGSR